MIELKRLIILPLCGLLFLAAASLSGGMIWRGGTPKLAGVPHTLEVARLEPLRQRPESTFTEFPISVRKK